MSWLKVIKLNFVSTVVSLTKQHVCHTSYEQQVLRLNV